MASLPGCTAKKSGLLALRDQGSHSGSRRRVDGDREAGPLVASRKARCAGPGSRSGMFRGLSRRGGQGDGPGLQHGSGDQRERVIGGAGHCWQVGQRGREPWLTFL